MFIMILMIPLIMIQMQMMKGSVWYQTDKQRCTSNKRQIKKAVKTMYQIDCANVNTLIR